MRIDCVCSLRLLVSLFFCLQTFAAWAADVPEKTSSRAIVTLSPAATEWIYALGLSGELRGVTEQCDYPPAAKSHAKVGSFMSTNVEQVLALRATDVVATQRLPAAVNAKFLRAGVRVHVFDPVRLRDFPLQIEALAKVFHEEERGRKLSSQFRAVFGKTRQMTSGELAATRSALVFVSARPIYLASGDSWLSDLFRAAGFTNAFPKATVDFPRVSFESLAKLASNYWFVFQESQNGANSSAAEYHRLKKRLGAEFANTRIVSLPSDIFQRPGPRLVEAYRVLQKEVK